MPNIVSLCSLPVTNSFMQDCSDRLSVFSLCMWRVIRLLRRTWLIVVRKYVFTLRRADALRSLTAFVAGITIRIVSKVHTSDMLTLAVGERLLKYSVMS